MIQRRHGTGTVFGDADAAVFAALWGRVLGLLVRDPWVGAINSTSPGSVTRDCLPEALQLLMDVRVRERFFQTMCR